ncbi:unnamed protein product [Dicrocoelium dendriticum]|nr:unnamed protein product [Dicrocoelium dendriticum]
MSMADFQNFKFEDTIPDLSPETRMKFRKFLQVTGIENMVINDGRRITDADVLNEIRKEMAIRSRNEELRTTSLIPACISGDDETVKALLPSGEYDVNEVAPDGETALTCAVSANALRIVEMLLKHGADPNFRGKKVECTPLMDAASVGYTDIVRLLLEYGACVGLKSNTGNTALHYAATAGHLECVCLLLQYNSPLEVQNETGHTPLMEATSNGHIDVARCLIKNGADINTHSTEFKESALTLASYKGHAEMVRFLLEAGADHEHRTDEMHTALMEAAMEGHVEVARLLLAHGANVNIPQDSFESPLTLAACGGHTALAHLLIGYGADIEEVNDEGYTPLMEAAREGHEETVALLLAVGADVNARTEETQETALTLAACGGFIEVCEMLLNAGADIEVGGVGCSTPLMEAAQEGHLDLVRRLLQRGAAVNAVTATGDTALHYAAENGHVKVCKELLDWGAVFGALAEGGRTPLMKAARSGNLEVVQLFLEHGAPIDQPTIQNDANALSLACSGGHAKVVKYLLQHGADPQYQLRDGSTMLIEAARSGSSAVLRLILDYPGCLTQPSTVPLPANGLPQLQHQQQLQLLQQHPYQSIANDTQSPAGATPGMPPPPPPPLPLPITTGGAVDSCLDSAYMHLHNQQHSLSCRAQHLHQPLPFQTQNPGMVVSTNPTQPPSHLDAALVSAYAVGWADGAASLVQQQHQAFSCSNAHPPESLILTTTNAMLDAASAPQSLSLGSCLPSTTVQQFRTIVGSSSPESQFAQMDGGYTNTIQPESNTNMVSCSSSATTNSLSGSSSVSSGSSASSLVAGVPADHTTDIGAGLLQALFQELMPDKEELLRRFEAVICPYNALRVGRPSLGQQVGNANATNAAAIALSRLVDQQQHCIQRSVASETVIDRRSPRQVSQCPHVSATFQTQVTRRDMLDTCGDELSLDDLPIVSVNSSELHRTLNTEDLLESATLGSSASNTTPILSSCHSSSSALSTPECSASSSAEVADSICLPGNFATATMGPASPLASQEFELDKAAELLMPSIDSPYLAGMIDTVGLASTQGLFHEPSNHEMLATCRHYHHPGTHIGCVMDGAATASAVANLTHPNSHPGLHHHHHHHHMHHHPLAVPPGGGGEGLVSSGMSVEALMANQAGALAYDPANVMATHPIHQSSLPMNGPRVIPMGSAAMLNSTGTCMSTAHVLNPADMSSVHHLSNPAMSTEPITPVNLPSLIDVNACIESSMETALTLACHGGYTELVRLLLERGADREHRDKKSHTPLHTAVYANQRAVIALLLDYGADVESQVDRTKDTALSIACSHGMFEIVEELLNRGANKEHRNISDYTPLSLAASGGHVEVIQLLLRHGAEINSRTGSKLGISPLMLASMNGHTNAVRLLLEHGSDINAHIETNRNTALTLACFQGRHAVVSLLVERKANIEHRAKTGLTPLMEAASGDYVDVGVILLEHGADVNAAPVPSSRDTALTIAADKGNVKFVNLLLEKGAIVEARNKKGATSLWLASNGGHLEVVQSLIQYNADVNSQDNRKVSCLMAAFRKGHVNVVRFLVQYVTQFPSDKDCLRHIKTAVTDKELAKRCQQCREIIIAAKEKQEGEARKNANCLLEQIEQEEEERANREAIQARKRERKRMKRKAKQEKERQGKEPMPTENQVTHDEMNGNMDPVSENAGDEPDEPDGSSYERRSPTLSHAIRHVRKSSFDSQHSNDSITDATYGADNVGSQSPILPNPESTKASCFSKKSESQPSVDNASTDATPLVHSSASPPVSEPTPPLCVPARQSTTVAPESPLPDPSISQPNQSTAATTEAKREKHRSKKQSQRAAKRAAAENHAVSDPEKLAANSVSLNDDDSAQLTPSVTSTYYPMLPNGNGELSWNALIESHGAQLSQYLTSSLCVSTGNEANSWTTVLSSGNTRAQRSTTQGRTGIESTDWKTTSNSSSFKRRISIPVSRHDIGKVIGQGGAVVSALRNMSGIQIDIESARSDEVTERMVYLKGPGDAVQRTYETIQGLLNGSIAGNDVLLMYAALKKSTTTANSTIGKTALSALSSKALSSAAAVTTVSSASKNPTPGPRTPGSGKSSRRMTKSSTSTATTPSVPIRTCSSQVAALLLLSRASSVASKAASTVTATCANSNNNSTPHLGPTAAAPSCTCTTALSTKITTSNSPNWSSRVLASANSTKGNFASVAAAGLTPHSRLSTRIGSESATTKPSQPISKYAAVPNLMQNFPSVPPTTAPVSLLSLNIPPLSSSSQMFPDLVVSFATSNDIAPDSMDEASFPPLNPKVTRASTVSSTTEKLVNTAPSTVPASGCESQSDIPDADSISQEQRMGCLLETEPLTTPNTSFQANGAPTSVPETLSCDVSPAVFKPLTVSPPVGPAIHASQPSTPVGSGSSHTTCSGTPPATTTLAKPFARAPGSERSAHQRNANLNSLAPSAPLGDSYAPSLIPLDVGVCTSISDSHLLTPTKRAISPVTQDSEFHSSNMSTCYRVGQSSEWLEGDPNSTTISQPCMSFQKTSGFSLDPRSSTDVSTSAAPVHQPLLGSTVTGLNTTKSQHRPPDSLHLSNITPWPIPSTDLNPNALAFEPSAFQAPGQSSVHQVPINNLRTTVESGVSLISSSMMRPGYGDLSNSDLIANAHSLDQGLVGNLRQVTSHAPLKPNAAGTSLQHSSCTPSSLGLSSFSQGNAVTNVARSKPLLSVAPNTFSEPHVSLYNGYSNSVNPPHQLHPSLSTLVAGTQFHSMYPSSSHQQAIGGFNSLTHQQASATSRLGTGGSPHPLFNQAQHAMGCPSISSGSYTPPLCVSGFMQPGGPAPAPHFSGSFSTQLLNVFNNEDVYSV